MKKMVAGSMVAFGLGAGAMAVAMKCTSTKKKVTKLVNNAVDMANDKLDSVK